MQCLTWMWTHHLNATLLPPTRQSTQQNIHWVQTPLPTTRPKALKNARTASGLVWVQWKHFPKHRWTHYQIAKKVSIVPSKEQGLGMWRGEMILHIFRSVVQQLLTQLELLPRLVLDLSDMLNPTVTNIHLSIALLVQVARLARTSPISEGELKIPPTHLHLLCNSSQLSSEFRRGRFLDLDALNLAVVSVLP
jgi:hypothetical protein